MAQLECRNLVLGYEGREIARDLSFEVKQGDYLCIVGENGSGKSTLMRTILGLKAPMSGEIITGDGLKQNEIGYLPQQTAVQKDFPATVWEIVLSGCQGKCGLSPFYSAGQKETARENIRRMGIEDLTKRCYRELSGGQQQRALLARALCATGKILLLDEPVSGLDPKVTAEMYELIKSLNDDGITIIMISHDLQAALKYSSHILHVRKNPFFGTTDEYRAKGMHYAGDQDYMENERTEASVSNGSRDVSASDGSMGDSADNGSPGENTEKESEQKQKLNAKDEKNEGGEN